MAALALSATGCEVIIGIPDVTLDTSGGAGTGGAGTGGAGTGGEGGAACVFTPCSGTGCDPVKLADAKDFADTSGESKGTDVAGLTARDGVAYWGVDRNPGGYVVRTTAEGVSNAFALDAPPRRLVHDGSTLFWSTVYTSTLALMPQIGTPSEMGTKVSTSSDRDPIIALAGSRAYWTINMLDGCAELLGCCGPGGNACLVGAEKGAQTSTVLVGGRATIGSVVRVGAELFFTAIAPPSKASIERCPAELAACSPDVFVDTSFADAPGEIVAAKGFLYWSTAAGIIRRKSLSDPGAAAQDIIDKTYVVQMVGDDSAVYYTTIEGNVYQISHGAKGSVQIGSGHAASLGLDCEHVYWGDDSVVVRRPR